MEPIKDHKEEKKLTPKQDTQLFRIKIGWSKLSLHLWLENLLKT